MFNDWRHCVLVGLLILTFMGTGIFMAGQIAMMGGYLDTPPEWTRYCGLAGVILGFTAILWDKRTSRYARS